MSASDILSLLDEAAATAGRIHCSDSPREGTAFSDLWSRSHRVGQWLRHTFPEAGTVAGVLSSSEACLSVLFGSWLAGRRFASLPEPARAMAAEEYRRQIGTILELAGTEVLFCTDPSGELGAMGGRSYREAWEAAPSAGNAGGGDSAARLIQFTSGSTGSPKGVVLTMKSIGLNCIGMNGTYRLGAGDVAVSWLPMSHDMGLVGTCLIPLAAMGRGGLDAVWLLTPEGFLRDPLAWLRVVTEARGTYTMVPNFSLDIMVRRLPSARALDLSSFRNITVAAETVRGESLRRFAAAAGAFGFDPLALSPAYGMAEVTLGASGVLPEEKWSSVTVERSAFAEGGVVPVDSGEGEEVVCLGAPYPSMGVRVEGEGVGPIEVTGPSLAEELIGSVPFHRRDGFFVTNDLGFLVDGALYFAGRSDDWIVVTGRNIDARDLEYRAGQHPALRPGNCVVVEDDRGTYAVVAEPNDPAMDPAAAAVVGEEVRGVLAGMCGVAPSRLVIVERGSLPKTPSGKVQRRKVGLLLHGDGLSTVAEAVTGALLD